jgi:hypothetical protein
MFSKDELAVRVLVRAAELAGGFNQLADYLGVSNTKLGLMLSGLAAVPEDIFLRAVDLVAARNLVEMTGHMSAPDTPRSTDDQNAP